MKYTNHYAHASTYNAQHIFSLQEAVITAPNIKVALITNASALTSLAYYGGVKLRRFFLCGMPMDTEALCKILAEVLKNSRNLQAVTALKLQQPLSSPQFEVLKTMAPSNCLLKLETAIVAAPVQLPVSADDGKIIALDEDLEIN